MKNSQFAINYNYYKSHTVKMMRIQKNRPLLASSEEEKPVEVIRRDRNCPNPRPTKVFFVQNSLELNIFSSRPKPHRSKNKNNSKKLKNKNTPRHKILKYPFPETPFLSQNSDASLLFSPYPSTPLQRVQFQCA